eukprot:gene19068-22693_t
MALRGNQFKSNSFKNESGEKQTTKPAGKQPRERFERMPRFDLQDGSYVIDANGGWHNLFKTFDELKALNITPVVQNWLGKFGALLAHQFIYEWFGLASFLFAFVFFVVGYRLLFKVRIFPLEKTLGYSFAHSFMKDAPHYIEGEFGYWTNRLLVAQIGVAGVGGLITFLALTILIVAYNIDFKLPERKKEILPDVPEHVELENEVRSEPVEFPVNDRYDSERKREQNVVISPNRFEDGKKEEPIPPPVSEPVSILSNTPIVLSPTVPLTGALQPSPSFTIEEKEEEKQEPELTIEKTEEEKKSEELVEQFGNYDPTLDLASYKYPHLDLLENYGSNKISVNAEELEANKNKIVETLNHYNIEIDKIKATIGPTVTLYEIIPAPGVRISKIKNLEDDIALSLAALGIRIIAPMPGKGTIGIEVPNMHPEMVSMRSILATEKFQQTAMDLPIAMGKTISNEVYIGDLSKMPHLLVAGATGQGKSVGINSILVSLLYKKHPSQLKFVLVDPKKVELTLFNKIERHFLAKLPGEADAIITDTKKVINTLNSLCIEMDQRYDLLKDAQVRNLKEYNEKFIKRRLNPNNLHRFLPYIVLIVDEFADLMMTADSRTILDSGGADQLIGRGDMLLSTGNDLIRLQCAFVDTPEVDRISEFIGNQRGYPE